MDQKRLDDLDFAIEKSLRYHQRRRAHYERLHKVVMFGVILSGSIAFAELAPYVALVGVVLATSDLVFGFAHKSRDHVMLHSDFTALAIDMRSTDEPDNQKQGEWIRRRLEIEAKEPATFWAVEASCYNEVCYARGCENEGLVELNWWHRTFMNWLRFESVEFPTMKASGPANC